MISKELLSELLKIDDILFSKWNISKTTAEAC